MRTKLRALRKQKGISQSFLALKLGYSHPSGYSNIENGRNRLSLEHAVVIAESLGVSVNEIVEDDESKIEKDLHILNNISA